MLAAERGFAFGLEQPATLKAPIRRDHCGFELVSVVRQARRRSTQLASSAYGSVQLRSLQAR